MNKIKNILISLMIILNTVCCAFAAENTKTVIADLGFKQGNPAEPSIMQIAVSLFIVILLVIAFAFVYSKLAKLNLHKLFKGEIKEIEKNSITVLSTTQLGAGKSVHVIEVNNKSYLIGATQSSVNLISEMKEEN